jgi:TRAP-type uncharacterized transport system fused permease subunit
MFVHVPYTCKHHTHTHTCAQGVSRLVDITTGGDFLGLCDKKCSYKHVSHFGQLRSYGHFLIPVHALVWTASYRTSWRVLYSSWWLIVCVARIIFATWLVHPATNNPVSESRHLEGIYGMRGRLGRWVFFRPVYTAWLSYCYVSKNSLSLTLQWLYRLLMFRWVQP